MQQWDTPEKIAAAMDDLSEVHFPGSTWAPMYQHPNLNAWRTILDQLPHEPRARNFAVFIASLDAPVSSPYDEALRQQIADGERAALFSTAETGHRSSGSA